MGRLEYSNPAGVILIIIGPLASSAALSDTTSNRMFGSGGAPGGAGRNCCAAAITGTSAITKTNAFRIGIRILSALDGAEPIYVGSRHERRPTRAADEFAAAL